MSRCSFRYEDLPARIKAQVDAQSFQRARAAAVPCPVVLTRPESESPGRAPAGRRVGRRCPNKTETAYRREILARRADIAAIHFEGLTVRMENGHRYTPDWVVVTAGGRIECHEVKGSHALHSQQRARLAFDQARVEFAWIVWVWATRTKSGWNMGGV